MLKLRPRVQNLVHVFEHTLGACTILMSCVRSLHTLWSLVCAKGEVENVLERGADISKALWEHQWGSTGRTRGMKGRTLTGQGPRHKQEWNPREHYPVRRWVSDINKFTIRLLPSKEVVTIWYEIWRFRRRASCQRLVWNGAKEEGRGLYLTEVQI